MTWRRDRSQLLLLALAALLLRVAYVWEIGSQPLFGYLVGDALVYDAWAREIAAGAWLGDEVFYQAPLYPYFLGSLYRFIGPDLLWTRLVQVTFGAGSCVLLALAGSAFFSRRVGLAAGWLLAVYPTAIFFDALVQKSVLDLFLISLLLYALGRIRTAPGPGRCLAVGLTLGCLILTRENAGIFAPVVLA